MSREGDLWRWDGFAARGDAPSAAARRLAERNRLEELEREARDAKTKRDAAREALDRIMRSMREAQEAESAAREAVRRITRQREEANAALQREMRRTEEVRLRLEAARLRRESVANDLIESRSEEAEARAARAALPTRPAQDPALAAQESRLAEARQAENAARDALARLFAARNAAEQRLAGIERERAAWDQRAARVRESLGEHENRRTGWKRNLRGLKANPPSCLPAAVESRAKSKPQKPRAKPRMMPWHNAKAQLRAAEDAARQAANALSQSRELAGRLEVARENADARLIHVIQTIEGEIEGPIEGLANRIAADPRVENLSPEAIEARLRDLKQDRDRLGAVNLRADTELNEVETRHADLTRERAEIEEAIRKFRRAIESLNSEGARAFARLSRPFRAISPGFSPGFSGVARPSFTLSRRMIRWRRDLRSLPARRQEASASVAALRWRAGIDGDPL